MLVRKITNVIQKIGRMWGSATSWGIIENCVLVVDEIWIEREVACFLCYYCNPIRDKGQTNYNKSLKIMKNCANSQMTKSEFLKKKKPVRL